MQFHVDVRATAAYRDKYNEPCDCPSCRNFRTAFPSVYPDAMAVLRKMGLQPDTALEVMDLSWNARHDRRRYEAFFCAKGELMTDGLTIHDSGSRITLYQWDTSEPIYRNTGMQPPLFFIKLEAELPWLLQEEAPN